MGWMKSLKGACLVCVTALLACPTLALCASAAFAQSTTIFLVRHAEKDGEGNWAKLMDPEGVNRARELAHVLKDAALTAIYVSNLPRTLLTAQPTAEATCSVRCLEPKPAAPAKIVKEILTQHIGGRILVVGHSDTVDDIAEGLGAKGISSLGGEQFDRLFVIHITSDGVVVDKLRYGEPTP